MLLEGHPLLWHVVTRVRAATSIDDVVVATTIEERDKPIREFCARAGISCFSGSEDDVLDRFYHAAVAYMADPVVRITADCPLVDPGTIDRVVAMYQSGKFDHVGVATGAGAAFEERRFPNGLDAECFSFDVLERAWRAATTSSDREHVTPFIWRQPDRFRLGVLRPERDYSNYRWSVDTAADFQLVQEIYAGIYSEGRVFNWHDALRYLASRPDTRET